ncbi:aqualysin-1-like [Diadema setosum]|uniref:aqualysin-1-like n=1 Tax=Diadema setosum TaxID=31175 RepID=UPI003B3B1F45
MLAFFTILLVAAASAELAPLYHNSEPIPGKYIIKLKDEYDLDEVTSTVRISGGHVGFTWRHALYGFAAELEDRVLEVVRSLPAVEYVEEDGVYRTQLGSDVEWGLDRIDQRECVYDDTYNPRGTGSGYTVYVIDTGVRDTHEEFGGLRGRAKQLVNYAGGSNEDCNGHGTHCAGTVGSNTYGVATGVQIRGVKVLNCLGSGSNSGVISGVDYVRKNAGSNSIASMSLGGGVSTSLDTAVSNLISSGVPTAVAAGNDNANANYYSPARVPSAITVGATTKQDRESSFSNYGSCLDIYAPGSSIKSTWHTNDSATRTLSGTSMACPHVAGAIALYQGSTSSMILNASNNKLSGCGSGSPNKLLYVG